VIKINGVEAGIRTHSPIFSIIVQSRLYKSLLNPGVFNNTGLELAYCPKCGARNPASASFCTKCGASFTPAAPAQAPPAQAPQYVSKPSGHTGMGTASLVMGILSIFIFGIILGPLALIFGAIAWGRDRDSFGLAGLILGLIAVILWVIVLVWVLTLF
jgi:hypothetical protein